MRKMAVKNLTLEMGRPKVAVPVTGKTHEEIVEQCKAVKDLPCDVIEWRVDYYLSAIDNLEEMIDTSQVHLEMVRILDDIDYVTDGMPVIFTIRTKGQGGEVSLDTERIHDLASLAAQSQLVGFVDMELFDENDSFDEEYIIERINDIHEFGIKVIMSYHDFEGMPTKTQIENIINVMRDLGGDICKVAAMAQSKAEAAVMLKVAEIMTEGEQNPVIMIAMGKEGIISRVAGGKYGSVITFAAGAGATAPGQLNAQALDKVLNEYYKG